MKQKKFKQIWQEYVAKINNPYQTTTLLSEDRKYYRASHIKKHNSWLRKKIQTNIR